MQTRSSPNLQTLHRLARQVNIEGYDKMPKELLYKKLQEQFNVDRLLRAENRSNKISVLNKNKKRKFEKEKEDDDKCSSSKSKRSSEEVPTMSAPLNKLDPIMLTPIGKKNLFYFTRPNGTKVRFNVDSLVDYLLVSGDFTDPETRLPFSDSDLKEIDRIAKISGSNKSSVFDAKHNTTLYNDSKFRRDALLGLERCAGEVVTDILELIENTHPDDAQMELAMREFPQFLDYFRQIREADPAYASKCISHWKSFLMGPPNKPNNDEFGLIALVCHFLRTCDLGHM